MVGTWNLLLNFFPFSGVKKMLARSSSKPRNSKTLSGKRSFIDGIFKAFTPFWGGILTLQCLQVFLLPFLFVVINFLIVENLPWIDPIGLQIFHRKTRKTPWCFPSIANFSDTQERMPIFPRLALVTVLLMSPKMYCCVFLCCFVKMFVKLKRQEWRYHKMCVF